MSDVPTRLSTALTGIRVVELARNFPGPYATLILADLGASVLKIEPPEGDPARYRRPLAASGRAAAFDALNAGKTTRRADLREPTERDALLAQLQTADILVESYRPGVMARLGLNIEALRHRFPRLIICSLSGFGAKSPDAAMPAYDVNVLALAGLLQRNGAPTPMIIDPPIADVTAGLFAVIAILAALRSRDLDGVGTWIDLALGDVAMPLQLAAIARLGATGHAPARGDHMLSGGTAYYQVYATRDGRHVALGAVEHRFWRAFCAAAGHPELSAHYDDPCPQAEAIAAVQEIISAMTLDECLTRFASAECCVTAVRSLDEALAAPHTRARDLVRTGLDGSVQALFPARIDGRPPPRRMPLCERQ